MSLLPLAHSKPPLVQNLAGESGGTASPSATPPQAPEGQGSNSFLTGLSCLQPVSEICLSGLLRLWQDPPASQTPDSEEEAATELDRFGKMFLRHSFGRELGDLLYEGISRYFEADEAIAVKPPEVECEVRKEPAGELRVECEARPRLSE